MSVDMSDSEQEDLSLLAEEKSRKVRIGKIKHHKKIRRCQINNLCPYTQVMGVNIGIQVSFSDHYSLAQGFSSRGICL